MYIDGLYRDCSPRIIWYSDFLEKACEVNAQPSPPFLGANVRVFIMSPKIDFSCSIL